MTGDYYEEWHERFQDYFSVELSEIVAASLTKHTAEILYKELGNLRHEGAKDLAQALLRMRVKDRLPHIQKVAES